MRMSTCFTKAAREKAISQTVKRFEISLKSINEGVDSFCCDLGWIDMHSDGILSDNKACDTYYNNRSSLVEILCRYAQRGCVPLLTNLSMISEVRGERTLLVDVLSVGMFIRSLHSSSCSVDRTIDCPPSSPYFNFTPSASFGPWMFHEDGKKFLFYDYFRSISLRFDRIISFEQSELSP